MTDSLYDRLGGEEAIEAVVDRFYERVLDDDRLAGYFEDTDVNELREHQRQFLSHVAGGPVEYDGRPMREAHADLGITEADFAAVAEHLSATLAEFDVPEREANEVMAAVADLEEEIVAT